MSYFYCHPGKAGGSPGSNRINVGVSPGDTLQADSTRNCEFFRSLSSSDILTAA
jgi:hypothetical protein